MTINPDSPVQDQPKTVHQCRESRDAFTETAFEYAFNLLKIHPVEEISFIEVHDDDSQKAFDEGWKVGVTVDLDEGQMPVEKGPKFVKSWVLGFIAGQYAATMGYTSPFCIFKDHEHGDRY